MTEQDERPMMTCGHSATGKTLGPDGRWRPSCLICLCSTVADERPDLTGRQARCSMCLSEPVPSRWGLAFFEYRGPGSRAATMVCAHCGMTSTIHPSQNPDADGRNMYGQPIPHLCENNGNTFAPKGACEYDSYYCGCRGWD